MSSNEKKLYTRVYTSEEKKEKQSSKQEQPLVKKKRDRIHNEIVGEFSNYGMRVHYGSVVINFNNPYLIR